MPLIETEGALRAAAAQMVSDAGGFIVKPQTLAGLPDGTAILVADFDVAHLNFDRIADAGTSLPPDLHRAIPKRQAEFLAGRLLTKVALTTIGCQSEQVPRGPDRAPIWPDGISGSITHSKTRAAALVSRRCGDRPGIDLEEMVKPTDLDTTFRHILTVRESDHLRSLPESDAITLATLLFSAKETLFKSLYPTVGRFFGFDCAEMTTHPERKTVTLRLTKGLHSDLPEDKAFDIAFDIYSNQVLTWTLGVDLPPETSLCLV